MRGKACWDNVMRSLLAVAALGVSACASLPPEKAVEQFMWDYTKAWNRHDSATIARDFYRTGPTVPEQAASLERSFENLRGQGYHHSDIFEIKGCMTGADTAWAGMKFSRLKASGEPLPPKDRASSYTLKKFEDGWRITRVGAGGVSADKPLECPAG
jgi:hypothetical protein